VNAVFNSETHTRRMCPLRLSGCHIAWNQLVRLNKLKAAMHEVDMTSVAEAAHQLLSLSLRSELSSVRMLHERAIGH
jgi:hypothetical protein